MILRVLRVLRVFRVFNILSDTSILAVFRGSILWLLRVLEEFGGSILFNTDCTSIISGSCTAHTQSTFGTAHTRTPVLAVLLLPILPVLAVFRPSVLLILPVLAVFRPSVLLILPVLAVRNVLETPEYTRSTKYTGKFYPQRSSGQAVVTGVVPSPLRYVPSFLSRIGFSIPTARRFSSNVANSRSRSFR